jgi:hypothetical protein
VLTFCIKSTRAKRAPRAPSWNRALEQLVF